MWRVLDTGRAGAKSSMDIAQQLLSSLPVLREPVLHLFEWARPTLTYGTLVKPQNLLDLQQVTALGLDMAQRPTGGGVMFHVDDLSFSLAIPAHSAAFSASPERNYAWVNQAVSQAIESCMESSGATLLLDSLAPPNARAARFCMSVPTRYDILWRGKKVGGAAQRCTRAGFLHQGSIALVATPDDWQRRCVRDFDAVGAGFAAHAGALLETRIEPTHVREFRSRLRNSLQAALATALDSMHASSDSHPGLHCLEAPKSYL